jgi:hypothetical protein
VQAPEVLPIAADRADATALDEPVPAAGIPLGAMLAHHLSELARDRPDVRRDWGCPRGHHSSQHASKAKITSAISDTTGSGRFIALSFGALTAPSALHPAAVSTSFMTYSPCHRP